MIGRGLSSRSVWVFTGLALATFLLYYPALHTPFLLDDFQNLRELSRIGRDGILAYVLEGRAGPGGRPLSLLSFALQYQSWPGHPFAFKLVNLGLHLASGGLVFFITLRLAPRLAGGRHNAALVLAAVVCTLWLLHPVQLSGVLYVVQRMNLLSGFFTLLGVALYLQLRDRNPARPRNLALLAAAVYGCTAAAVLCKENGILLPAYILCLEFVLLGGEAGNASRRRRLLVLAGLPLAAAAAYLLWTADSLLAGYASRPFTPGQRLLTEAGVLMDYLRILLLPYPSAFTLFHDDYPVSTALAGDPRASAGVAGLILLLVSAWIARRRARVYSFAVAWFLAGHVLESSFVPLELYFEHRNYIPSFGILLLAGTVLVRLSRHLQARWLSLLVLGAYPLATVAVTALDLQLWSSPYRQAVTWAAEHPGSRRALNNLWNMYLVYGQRENAEAARHRLQSLNPGSLYPYIKQVTVTYCYYEERYTDAQWRSLYGQAARADYTGHAARDEIDFLLQRIAAGQCRFPDLDSLHRFIHTMTANPAFRGELGYLYEYAATVAVLGHDGNQALEDINRAVARAPTLDNRIYKMRILLALGEYGAAGKLLEKLERRTGLSPENYIKLSRARRLYRQRLPDAARGQEQSTGTKTP